MDPMFIPSPFLVECVSVFWNMVLAIVKLRRLGCAIWILVTVFFFDNPALSLDSDNRVFVLTPATFYGISADNMTSEKKCCVPFCDSQKQILHKFPNPDKYPDQFRTWLYNIGGDILRLQNEIIFKRRRVCHLHFESKFHTRSKLLSPDAVPTLNLSVPTKRRLPLVDISNPIASSSSKGPDTTLSPSNAVPNTEINPPEQSKSVDETHSAINKEVDATISVPTMQRLPLVDISNPIASSSSKGPDTTPSPSNAVPNTEIIPPEQSKSVDETHSAINREVDATISVSRKRRLPLADISNPIASCSSKGPDPDNTTPSLSNVVPNTKIIPPEQSKSVDETHTAISSSKAVDATVLSSIVPDTEEVKQVKASDEVKQHKRTTITVKSTRKPVKCEKALNAEILKLKKENDSFQRRLKKAKSLSTNSAFQMALKKFKTLAAIFTVMQFREINKPKMGRRFTKEEKCMALSMYKVGPKAYRWLSKIFVLPSPVTLSRMVSQANLKPGINENLFEQLKRRVQKMKRDDRLCTLIFDEMSLSPHFEYNRKKDQISGFVNYTGEAKQRIADHVLVFMIRGVTKNYKQSVSYSFCSGSTPREVLAVQIKKIIKKLQDIGFIVLATICDQGTSNTSAINYLIEETRTDYLKRNECLRTSTFEIQGQQVIPLYDVPHLLKGMRNNLLTKNLKFVINGEEKVAKWDHITQLYENNPTYKGLKLIKNLSENHCNKDKIPKMKVKYASQLFSQTVGKTMGYLAENGILAEETKDTADLILFIDDLFDSLNGSQTNSNVRSGKDLLCNVTPKSRHSEIWSQAKTVLRSMKFVNMKGSAGTVPSINNWIKTIEGMELLREKLFNDYNIKSFWCRHLNQDPLENFFGCIRSHGIRNNSPSCAAFEAAFASLLVTNLSSNYSPGANCENDFCTTLQSFEELFFKKKEKKQLSCEVDINDVLNENIIICFENKKGNPRIIAQLEYVTGYLLRKSKEVLKNCKNCKKYLYTNDPGANKYIKQREYFKNKKLLNYPSEPITKMFSEMQDTLHHILRNKSHTNDIKNYMKTILYVNINTSFINCDKHKSELIEFLFEFSSRFFANNWTRITNQILNGASKDVDTLDHLQNQAQLYYKKRQKLKKK